jgi:hypothetical protein
MYKIIWDYFNIILPSDTTVNKFGDLSNIFIFAPDGNKDKVVPLLN